MKLIQQLLEMAKSSTKRASQAKRRRKKKIEKPSADKQRNLAAVDMQTTGAGAHGTQRSKQKKGRASRREGKQQTQDY